MKYKRLVFFAMMVALPIFYQSMANAGNADNAVRWKMIETIMEGCPKDQNRTFSPEGLLQMLDVLHAGVKSETEVLLRNKILKNIFIPSKDVTAASFMLAQNGVEFQDDRYGMDYRSRRNFNLHYLNFGNECELSGYTKTINDSCKEITDGLIPKAIKGDFKSETKLALINAIMFKKEWKKPFKKMQKRRGFVCEDERSVPVFFMSETLYIKASVEKAQYHAGLLPYKQEGGVGAAAMLVVLPRGSVSGSLDFSQILDELQSQRNTETYVQMPVFKAKAEEFDCRSVLMALGCEALFEKVSFDLSPDSQITDMHLDSVKQTVVIDVDEKGTRAAAVTSSIASDGLAKSLILNKPFYYFILDRNNAVLFAGYMANPAQSE